MVDQNRDPSASPRPAGLSVPRGRLTDPLGGGFAAGPGGLAVRF